MPADELRRVFEIEVGEAANATLERIRAQRVPATPRTILGDLRGDLTFVKPGLAVAAAQAKIGRNIFAYLFDGQSPNSALGACHCINLPFLFGNIDVWKAAPMLSGADWKEVGELSRLFRRALAAFAEKGDPNGANLAEWPSYECRQA